MSFSMCSLSSGSSGNCYVIRSDEGVILVDAGISARRICQGLESLGLGPSDISAILITHEHADHVQGLQVLAKKTDACLYATEGTLRSIREIPLPTRAIKADESFAVAGMTICSFPVSHDAAQPVGYTVSCGNAKLSIVTDTGIVTSCICDQMRGCDILVLESNHDESILRVGRYPRFLKERILGSKGHLSNDSAAKALACVIREERDCGCMKKRQVLLAHLSRENNFPEMALASMENILEEEGVAAGASLKVDVLPRTQMSPVYSVQDQ